MSTTPQRNYGQWKPGNALLKKIGALVGAALVALAGWLFTSVFGGEGASQGGGGVAAGGRNVDTRNPEAVLADLGDMEAARRLRELRIRPHKEAGPYDRSVFGEAWADVDNNGCDTRNDVLARDLDQVSYRKGSRCVVDQGVLHDPYVGKTINYKRGPKTSPLVQIDHVVALGDAWRSGAYQWSASKRQEFANDPNNLLAVDGQANQDKESSRADQWMPPRQEYWCEYATRQIRVKHEWDLSVAPQEREALIRALSTCQR